MYQCRLCDDQYDRESRKPLLLPCGHILCATCIENLSSNNLNECPECEECWGNADISKFTICYQALPSNQEDQNDPSLRMLDSCYDHGTKNSFWCLTCKKILSLASLTEKHKKCDWCSFEKAVNNESETLSETTRILTSINEKIDKVDDAINSNKSKCTALRLFKVQIEKLVEKTKHFLGTLQSSKSALIVMKKKLSDINSDNFTASKLQELAVTDDLIKEYERLQVIL